MVLKAAFVRVAGRGRERGAPGGAMGSLESSTKSGIAAYEFTSWGRPWVSFILGLVDTWLVISRGVFQVIAAVAMLHPSSVMKRYFQAVVGELSFALLSRKEMVVLLWRESSNFKSIFSLLTFSLQLLQCPFLFWTGRCPLKIYTTLVVETGISPPVCMAKSISIGYLSLYPDFCEECLKFLGE